MTLHTGTHRPCGHISNLLIKDHMYQPGSKSSMFFKVLCVALFGLFGVLFMASNSGSKNRRSNHVYAGEYDNSDDYVPAKSRPVYAEKRQPMAQKKKLEMSVGWAELSQVGKQEKPEHDLANSVGWEECSNNNNNNDKPLDASVGWESVSAPNSSSWIELKPDEEPPRDMAMSVGWEEAKGSAMEESWTEIKF